MAKNNYPQTQLGDMEPGTVQNIVMSLKQLHDKGKPKTDAELKQRIDEYFDFCQHSSIRPGIESLCMALHISRTTLFRWNDGENCSLYRRRQDLMEAGENPDDYFKPVEPQRAAVYYFPNGLH